MVGLSPKMEAAPEAEEPEAGEPASPEEQMLYDKTVSNAYDLIFKDGEEGASVNPAVLESLRGGDNPRQALGETAATVFFRVLQSAAENGVEMPQEVKEAAGVEVFETMAEIATKAGVADFMQDEEAFNGAFFIALDSLRVQEQEAGMIDPAAAAEDLKAMAADEAGVAAAMGAA